MSAIPPTPPDASAAPPFDVRDDLALGRLEPPEAARLLAACEERPAWGRALEQSRALAGALSAERFYAMPPDLVGRILDGGLAPGPSLWARWVGLAGAVALALGALTAQTGRLPDAPAEPPTRWVAPPIEVRPDDLWSALPSLPTGWAPWSALAAAGLLAGGVLLARRWARAAGGVA